jgi:hypothetical protein
MDANIESAEAKTGYWRMVWGCAFQFAWKDGGMKTRLLVGGFSIFIGVFAWLSVSSGVGTTSTLFNQPALIPNAITALVSGFGAFLVYLLVHLLRIPPTIDQEKNAEIAHLQREKNAEITRYQQQVADFEEHAKPKLELYLDNSDESMRHIFPGGISVFRVKIRNKGLNQVRDISVVIKSMSPAIYRNLPLELNFMNGASNTLNPTQVALVDVIQAHYGKDKIMFFYAMRPEGRVVIDLAPYEIVISATASNSPAIEQRFKLDVSGTAEQPILRFLQVEQPML